MNKSELEQAKKLCFQTKSAAFHLSDQQMADAEAFCEGYKDFLNAAKTEREAAGETIRQAVQHGFQEFDPNATYQPGDKIFFCNREKSVILAVLGSQPLELGANIVAAHIDAPRLDLKPMPLYEDSGIAFFKTHYYGGIKKYQWTSVPLSLHGVIFRADGEKITVNIGEQEGDPVFCVTDLLPHLAYDQMKRSANDLVRGEELNITIGSLPLLDEKEKDLVKLRVLTLLHEKYGITERDFVSAELEMVPACSAADVGLDRSMVGAYGQDDRVCSYTALQAIFSSERPQKTTIVILADKEEIGSEGNTGMNSHFFNDFVECLAEKQGTTAKKVFAQSACLSADVSAAFDPTFADAYERRNSAMCGHGVFISKYTGSRGKSGTSDASAEFVHSITRLLTENEISWQIGELGKVDGGGGGTVAMFLAKWNMDVLDIGVPILSMHAPFELASKLDIFETYRAFSAFFNQKN